MSASRQKKMRQQAGEAVPAKKAEKKENRTAWIAGGVFAAVLILLAIFFAVYNSGLFEHNATAVTAGSHKVSPAMYNFFYLDASVSSPAVSPEELPALTNRMIARTYAVYDEALRNGFTMSESQRASIDSEIANVEYYASYSGAASVSAYLTAIYGAGCDETRYREYLEVRNTALLYTNQYAETLSYTPDQIDAYYAAHREDLDTVSYRLFDCESENDARAFAAAAEGDEAAFAEQARQFANGENAEDYENDSATLNSDVHLGSLPDGLHDWLSDPARQYGETTVVDNGDGAWRVAQFVDNWTKHDGESTIDVRHILVRADEETSAEQARAKADELLTQYLAGAQTEDAFAQLAVENSADSNAADGGIYRGVTPGQMVATFNDWCFDPARQPGDTGVVETNYGAHVMYFVRNNGSYRDSQVSSALRSEDGDAWAESLGETLTVTPSAFGMHFVTAGKN